MQYRLMNWTLRQWERLRREDGQAMIEYGVIVALISVAAVALFPTIGGYIKDGFTAVKDALTPPA